MLSLRSSPSWSRQADGTDKQRVTSNAGRYADPEYTPDGDIIFTKNLNDAEGTDRLFTVAPDGTGAAEIAPDVPGNMRHGTFAPGGERIAFQYSHNNTYGIYTVRHDGTGLTKVTGGIFAGHPDYAPDGTRITFSRENSMGTKVDVFRISKNGDNLKNLTTNSSGEFSRPPAYSPDGNRIAFDPQTSGSSDYDIFTMRSSDGGGRSAVAATSLPEMAPSWQPN